MFIGVGAVAQQAAITEALDACLLTDDEMAAYRAADDDAKPAGAPDELELKDFLEEYFTHGDACPCYEITDADARAAPTRGADARHAWF